MGAPTERAKINIYLGETFQLLNLIELAYLKD